MDQKTIVYLEKVRPSTSICEDNYFVFLFSSDQSTIFFDSNDVSKPNCANYLTEVGCQANQKYDMCKQFL